MNPIFFPPFLYRLLLLTPPHKQRRAFRLCQLLLRLAQKQGGYGNAERDTHRTGQSGEQIIECE